MLSLGLMYAKKNHQFRSSTKRRCTQEKIGSFFCLAVYMQYKSYAAAAAAAAADTTAIITYSR